MALSHGKGSINTFSGQDRVSGDRLSVFKPSSVPCYPTLTSCAAVSGALSPFRTKGTERSDLNLRVASRYLILSFLFPNS